MTLNEYGLGDKVGSANLASACGRETDDAIPLPRSTLLTIK